MNNDNNIVNDSQSVNTPVVVQTDVGSKNGVNYCPSCGATDISLNVKNGKLRCNYCRCEFEPEKVSGMVEDLSKLQGQVMGSGAQDIDANSEDVITFKCSYCGAEVVIDTTSSTQARCHWCRNTLSINQQIPNGAVPDVVLPFSISRDQARSEIEQFVGKRKFFAHPKFKKEFTTENVMGVYFPYMLVDVNGHSILKGTGEHQTRMYTTGTDENKETYYDADAYHVERHFDIIINGLSIESNADRLNSNSSEKTNNIINSIMPFDIENCVKYNSNYLTGYTSEKRNINIDQLKPIVEVQSKDIARIAANETLKNYDRGVSWASEELQIKGQQWKAAYLPVWLYSYLEVKGSNSLLHYVAVNARTKETMGSVPIHMPKLFLISFLVELLGIFLTVMLASGDSDSGFPFIFLLSGFIYFAIIYARYRNKGARHTYEFETKKQMSDVRGVDQFIESRKGLRNSMINGCNNRSVHGAATNNSLFAAIGQEINNNIKK